MALVESKSDLNIKLLINTRKKLILAIILVWGAVGLIFFAIKPQVESVFSVNKKLDLEKDQYQKVTNKLNELKQIQVSDQFQQKEKVDQVLPSYKPVLELLFNLNQAFQLADVSVTSFRISPGEIATPSAEQELISSGKAIEEKETRNTRGYNSLSFELTIKGDSENVDEFLDIAEKITPFTSIVELSIRGERGGGESNINEAEIVLDTYYYTQVISTNIEDSLPSVGDEELRAFNTIMDFVPSTFEQPTEIRSSEVEDLFDVPGFEFDGVRQML